jgi:hypothetical protein
VYDGSYVTLGVSLQELGLELICTEICLTCCKVVDVSISDRDKENKKDKLLQELRRRRSLH